MQGFCYLSSFSFIPRFLLYMGRLLNKILVLIQKKKKKQLAVLFFIVWLGIT